MTSRQKLSSSAAVALVAVALIAMVARHQGRQPAGQQSTARASAIGEASQVQTISEVTNSLSESGVTVDKLAVRYVDGIVILRGRVNNPADIDRATAVVKAKGHARVANLIQLVVQSNDDAIERDAERQIARTRSLDGCHLAVNSDKGILTVSGRVRSELQKDAARNILSNVAGVREVRTEIRTF